MPTGQLREPDEGLERIFTALELDGDRHLLERSTEADLAALESATGRPLPDVYRRLLLRLGGGLYYDRHEVFGGRRMMVHDIELVPSALSMRSTLAAAGAAAPPYMLPFHRDGAVLHWLDLRDGRVQGTGGRSMDLAGFLASVVLASTAR
jgi:hypothetical protein